MNQLILGYDFPKWGRLYVNPSSEGVHLHCEVEEKEGYNFTIRYRPFRFIDALREALDSSKNETHKFKEENFFGNIGFVLPERLVEMTLSFDPPNYFYWYGRETKANWEEFMTILKRLPVPVSA